MSCRFVAERDNNLVQNDFVQYFKAGLSKTLCKATRMGTAAVDEFLNAMPAERTQGRPDVDASPAP